MEEPTYKDFGAVVDKKKVEFKLFFPDETQYERGGPHRIKEIRVMGDFQSEIGGKKNWDFNTAPVMAENPHPNGELYTFKIDKDLPDGFYQYKYFVEFKDGERGICSDTDSHDHSTIVNAAGGRSRWFKTQPPAITLLTSPGAVMIRNGQEFGEDYLSPLWVCPGWRVRKVHYCC